MPLFRLAEMTWEEVEALDPTRTVAILPIGAMEAHGPHLPLSTDVIIAEAMARACAEQLEETGHSSVLLPALHYTHAGFAEAFAGTLSVSAESVTRTVLDIAGSLARSGIRVLALANAHLDPGHLASLAGAVAGAPAACRIVMADVTRRKAAERLTEEFRSGACHAGRYEGSIVLAEAPHLVRKTIAQGLPENRASLVDAIRIGHRTFADAGGPRAYFGAPAEASAAEGSATVAVLGSLLAEAVMDEVGEGDS